MMAHTAFESQTSHTRKGIQVAQDRKHAAEYGADCTVCGGPCRVPRWETTDEPGIYRRRDRTGKRWLYRVVVRDATGHQQAKTADTWEEAKEAKATGVVHKPRNVRAGHQTLQDLYAEWHTRKKYAEATSELHEVAWRKLADLHDLRISKIDRPMVDRVLGKIDKPVMREKTRILLSTLLGYAVAQKRLDTNHATKPREVLTRTERLERGASRNGKPKRYLNDKELQRLLDATDERYRALVELMARVGLRPGEAFALRVGKLKAEEGTFDSVTGTFGPARWILTVDTSTTGFTKTGEGRSIVLPAVVAEMIFEHVERFTDPDDPDALVFPDANGDMIDDARFRYVFSAWVKSAGLDGHLTPNDLRHSAASFAIAHGATVYAVQRMLGHARASITLDTYAELWDESQEELATVLDVAIRNSNR
jgi:integrase